MAHCLCPAWMLSGWTRCVEITGAGGTKKLRNFNNEMKLHINSKQPQEKSTVTFEEC